MRTKAIADLGQMTDGDFFKQVSLGLGKIIENANTIEQDARLLQNDKKNIRGSQILMSIAIEEMAKCLILLDAVRCPRENAAVFSRQLKKFNDHLSKGLYIESCDIRPATFGEVKEWIDNERKEYYLDGPNDVDWIFRNWILQKREETIYVDFVEADSNHFWLSPKRYDDNIIRSFDLGLTPDIVKLVYAFAEGGFFQENALKAIAEIWRPVQMKDETHWIDIRNLNEQTLQKLNNEGLLIEQPSINYVTIKDRWFFPLHALDTRENKVNKAGLRKIQDDYYPY